MHSIIVSSIQGQLDSDEIFWMNTRDAEKFDKVLKAFKIHLNVF